MNRVAAFVTEKAGIAWSIALAMVVLGGIAVGQLIRDIQEVERLSLLTTEAERRGVDLMSQTLNGNVMGSLALLGVIDEEIKQDALGIVPPNGKRISTLLEAVARSHGADGVFVIGKDGVLTSSWDISGKPSTGLNVRFRPYYQMAIKGLDNVYAAVSLARGDRALYFSTPVFANSSKEGGVVGAVVARTGLARVDALLKDKADIALLLSPQGVVFAGSRAEWVGFLAGAPTPERLRAIRDLKQFGNMFEKNEPSLLPFAAERGRQIFEGRRFALASAQVRWNDPFGDWTLLLMEDMSRSISGTEQVWGGLTVSAILLLLAMLGLKLLRGHHAQILATQRIEAYAQAQAASAERKSQRAEAALRFQRTKSPNELAATFLAEAHRILGALQGMIYVLPSVTATTMRLAASYACSEEVPRDLGAGEGLLGQCILDRQPRVLDTTDHHSWIIRSGLGHTRPAAVMMAPLLLDDVVLGVVEISVIVPPDHNAQEQFIELAALLALNLEILRRHEALS
ncbi:MAG: GAF domain-containing protein [Magnetospirillum sp.]|nr:GAF domain-containing protein [Magnetospirillum sp.]